MCISACSHQAIKQMSLLNRIATLVVMRRLMHIRFMQVSNILPLVLPVASKNMHTNIAGLCSPLLGTSEQQTARPFVLSVS